MKFLEIIKSSILFLSSFAAVYSSPVQVKNLTCEYRTNPIALEKETPNLSWQILSDARGFSQSAYRILIADSEGLLQKNIGNVWDSGKVPSDDSVNVAYGGKPLKPGTCYYWKVKVWGGDNSESAWSKPAKWRQVKANPKMNWISYKDPSDKKDSVSSIWYRKNFVLNELPEGDVFADVATSGYFELYVNGKKIGRDVLSPSVSGKDKRTFYVTYNIKDFLNKGENTIGVWVARGWGGAGQIPLAFRCDFKNGEPVLQTDSSWKAHVSPYATIGTWSWGNFGGEAFDAAKSIANWNSPDFDDSEWENARQVKSPSPVLEAQPCELNRLGDYVKAQSITKLDNGAYEIAFEKALTGNCRIFFPKLSKGDTVIMHFADTRWTSKDVEKTPAGKVPTMGLVFTSGEKLYRYPTYNQRSVYVASGGDGEYFESKFNPLGFQYIVVEGLKEAPIDAYAALVECDLERLGVFECSNDLFMKIHEVNDWTMRCLNQGGVYVDCPQRERLGYGDAQVAIESSIMNYYMPSFYRKFVKDWVLRQDKKTGQMPNVAPNSRGGGGPAWAGFVAASVWRNYVYYADKALLEEMYPAMSLYLRYLESKSSDGLYKSEKGKWNSIGDWLAPGRGMDTNNWPDKDMAELFNNCYIAYLWDIQRKAASALGREGDSKECAEKLAKIRRLIHEKYYDAERKIYVSDEQTYLLMPLFAGVVPPELKAHIWEKLEANIEGGEALQTGMLGTYFMINFLLENNRGDLLYKMINHTRYPGWGYMLSQGASVWWEQWNGYYSHMHSVFTSLDSWFYQGLAGIRPLEENPGMKIFIVKPAFGLPLNFVKASTESMYGKIRSEWSKEFDGSLNFLLEIPPNSKAKVYFPTSDVEGIVEGNVHLKNVKGLESINVEDSCVTTLLSAGKYSFKIDLE